MLLFTSERLPTSASIESHIAIALRAAEKEFESQAQPRPADVRAGLRLLSRQRYSTRLAGRWVRFLFRFLTWWT